MEMSRMSANYILGKNGKIRSESFFAPFRFNLKGAKNDSDRIFKYVTSNKISKKTHPTNEFNQMRDIRNVTNIFLCPFPLEVLMKKGKSPCVCLELSVTKVWTHNRPNHK